MYEINLDEKELSDIRESKEEELLWKKEELESLRALTKAWGNRSAIREERTKRMFAETREEALKTLDDNN